MIEQGIDIEEIVRLHKELWDKTTEKIDITRNGNLDIAKIVYSECCAYLRGQMVNIEKNKRMEEKRREEQERFNTVFQPSSNSISSKQLGTTKTSTTLGDVDLPPRFSIVDPRNPDKTLYNVESGMAIDTLGAYKGTLEPRAGKTGPYYLLKGIGILTRNKNNWYLKDKRNGQWVTIGVLKI